jgi:hypothetical protein
MYELKEKSLSEEQDFNAVQQRLILTKVLLQYSCAAYTQDACTKTNIKKVIAVESNKSLSDSVYESTLQKEKLHMVYANLGEVDDAGRPTTTAKFKNFHTYMVLPWALADKYMLAPDTILINGPFKIACFLYSLICAQEGAVILFDDFFKNPAYEMVRNYCALEKRHGDMAEFIVHKNYVLSDITAHIAKYSVIPD